MDDSTEVSHFSAHSIFPN